MFNNKIKELIDNSYVHVANNKYIHEVIKRNAWIKPGIKRNIFLMGVLVVEFVKHRFNLWDYQDEIDLVKKNNYIYSFERYGKNITMYLPHYEEDFLQKCIVEQSDFYEVIELEYLRDTFLKGGNVILDIGANIGNHTVFFSKICNAEKVYAFEPVAETYDTLCRNIDLNHIENTVVAYNVALGNASGKARIKYFDPLNIGSTQIEEADDGNIGMKRLDDYQFERIDFIKIDVETYEYDLLQGAKNTLTQFAPVIFVEIFDDCFSKVDKLLESYGYINSYIIFNNYIYVKSANNRKK